MSWRTDLLWYFGVQHRLTPMPSTGLSETGVRGSGNRGTKGCFTKIVEPNLDALARFGTISRRLTRVGDAHRHVLSLAYGDLGSAVTECSLHPQRRWRALAPLTSVAQKRGPKWLRGEKARRKRPKTKQEREASLPDERDRDLTAGDPGVHFAAHLLGKDHPTVDERRDLEAMQVEARLILRSAEAAYAAVDRVAA